MRDEFVGDDRDLLKWSLVLELAEPERHILYVPMYRRDARLLSGEHAIREDVREFFRKDRVKSVATLAPRRFDVVSWDEYNDSERNEYFGAICQFLSGRAESVQHAVFIDPDTGIQSSKPNSKHVRDAQLAMIWSSLRPMDLLIVYQHAPQNRLYNWVKKKTQQFAAAIGISAENVQSKTMLDVCFLWVTKG